MTSHDCVYKIRKLTGIKKVGHTGTLDPNVEGVLTICIGEATKVIPFIQSLPKTYVAELYLGKATTTEDADGELVTEKELTHRPSEKEIDHVFEKFTGDIEQQVPLYAAVKVKGKKLYEYARENIPVERPIRNVTIYRLEQIQQERTPSNRIRFRVTCSKGTYIRTLCVDLGKAFGYPAHMSYLLREESDSIHLDETVTFTQLERASENDSFQQYLLPVERILSHMETYEVDAETKKRVLQGQKLPARNEPNKDPFIVMHRNQLLAIYEHDKNNDRQMKPVRVFNLYKE